jgi:hypothetical protein
MLSGFQLKSQNRGKYAIALLLHRQEDLTISIFCDYISKNSMKEPLWLKEPIVRAMQADRLAQHGGSAGVRDENLLSASLPISRQNNRRHAPFSRKTNQPLSRMSLVNSTLKNDPIWYNITQTLNRLDTEQIATQHLAECNSQIYGYWDEDKFYEAISFTQKPHPKLMSVSLSISPVAPEERWVKLKFALVVNPSDDSKDRLGELILILDENLEIIDENWLIDAASPYVLAR